MHLYICFKKISKYCCLLFMKDFLNHLSHFSEDFKITYSYKQQQQQQ